MIGVQELIHKLELGAWARPLKVLTALLGVLAFTVWYDFHEYRNFAAPEAMEAAQLGRNLAAGKGFVTECVRPLTIHLVEKQQGVEARLSHRPHPDLANPPVYPLLLAGLMKVLPFDYQTGENFLRYQPEVLIAILNQALFFLMVWLVFRLARRLFDGWVALVTAVVLLGCDTLWRFSVSGLSTMLLLVIWTALVWVLVRLELGVREGQASPTRLVVWALVAGALVGLGGLTRYAFAWVLAPVLVFGALYWGPRRGALCGCVVLTFLVLMTPWLARNYTVSGTLFGVPGFALYQETPTFPGNRLERSLDPDLSQIELQDFLRKLFVNGAQIVREGLPRLGGSWVSVFFLVGLMLPFRNPALSRLRVFLLLSLLVLGVVQALGHTHLSADAPEFNSENLLVLLAPLVFLFGVGLFFPLLDQLALPVPELRWGAIGFFTLVGCGSLLFALLPPRTIPIVYPPYLPPWIRESAQFLRPNELMMSDMPWAVAWYGDRTCVWTTLDTDRAFFTINDEHKTISALYLTAMTLNGRLLTELFDDPDWRWGRFAMNILQQHSSVPNGFPLQSAWARYIPNQLLLCDWPRWRGRAR